MATFSYNGVVFTTLYRSRISSRPVLDDAQRTVVYIEHTLDVDGYITPSVNSVDAKWEIIRQDLTAVGGELIYTDKGFGELIVNSTQRLVKDVKWGPIPQIVDFAPLGGDCNAARIHWRCVTRIPECLDAKYRDALLAYNYEATYEIDQDGYTKLRVSGYIEVPMTRNTVNTRTLPDSVDRYRQQLQRSAPTGFQRQNQSYRISQDKRRMDFSYMDVQLTYPYPKNVTSIQARQNLRSTGAEKVKWDMTLTATITMARSRLKSEALAAFLLILAQKTERLTRQGVYVLPDEFVIDDDMFGRSTNFTWSGKFFPANLEISDVLKATRVWVPAGDPGGWALWQTSMIDTQANTVRGASGLELLKEHDAIIDLCLGGGTAAAPPGPKWSNFVPPVPSDASVPADTSRKAGWRDPTTPANSWIEYENSLAYEEESGTIQHKLLPKNPPSGAGGGGLPPGAGNPGGNGIPPGKLVVGPPIAGTAEVGPNAAGSASTIKSSVGAPASTPQGGAPADVYQRRTSAKRYVRMVGYAQRVGWRIPPPRLVSVGGQTPVEISRLFNEVKTGGTAFAPIYEATWTIIYSLPSAPSALPALANPMYAGDDGGNGPSQTLSP